MVQVLPTLDTFFRTNSCLLYVLFKIILYLLSNYRNIGDPVVACLNISNLELKMDCILLK
jgi:hypothetical protein